MNIHGLSCVHQIYDVAKPEKETLRVQFSFIRKGDPDLYLRGPQHGDRASGGYDAEFGRIVDSFQELRDPARLNDSPAASEAGQGRRDAEPPGRSSKGRG